MPLQIEELRHQCATTEAPLIGRAQRVAALGRITGGCAALAAAGKRAAFVDLAALIGRHEAKNGRGKPFVRDEVTAIA